ncbi:hypothetical protein G9A89_008831 [Geosiphon pyriformis]|nr:hypothetical protein G9A89_008831 [Geosiphon pyriformis]
MEAKSTYYEVLGITIDATEEDIRKAYRKQALAWHPDKNVDRREEAEARFKLIAEAYEILSDTEKRQIYDEYGEDGLKNGGGFENSSFRPFHSPEEIFQQFFGASNPFASFFGGGRFDDPFFFPGSFAGSQTRSMGERRGFGFDNDPFFSSFGPGGGSSSSFSFSSSSFGGSGGGQGGIVSQSTTTRIVNGVKTTTTTQRDAQGNVTTITESADGTRQVTVNGSPQMLENTPRTGTRIQIQEGSLHYPPHQQQQQQQQQYQQQQQQQQQPQQRTYPEQTYQQQSQMYSQQQRLAQEERLQRQRQAAEQERIRQTMHHDSHPYQNFPNQQWQQQNSRASQYSYQDIVDDPLEETPKETHKSRHFWPSFSRRKDGK